MEVSKLYKRSLYLNDNLQYIFSSEIIEYDMQSAGFNLTKYFKLLPEDKIEHLSRLPKKERQIQEGLYQKENKVYKQKLAEKFIEARRMFFEANNIQDDQVLSIKKDAIIMLRRCDKTTFGNIVFAEKNVYSSYLYLNKVEFYFNRHTVDIKGIDDDKLVEHRNFMIAFLHRFTEMMEVSAEKHTISFVKNFMMAYKERELPIGYYRELNSSAMFRLKVKYLNNTVGVRTIGEVDKLDIGYNFTRYIVPLISILS